MASPIVRCHRQPTAVLQSSLRRIAGPNHYATLEANMLPPLQTDSPNAHRAEWGAHTRSLRPSLHRTRCLIPHLPHSMPPPSAILSFHHAALENESLLPLPWERQFQRSEGTSQDARAEPQLQTKTLYANHRDRVGGETDQGVEDETQQRSATLGIQVLDISALETSDLGGFDNTSRSRHHPTQH
ncbi:hypothetical protein PAXINDRAFT_154630 [Paxillus involutus ATCC 200175]|nr:hypothetical protein PAXINDRAFT_154630 [Paxillus involutus ATCC 200175]